MARARSNAGGRVRQAAQREFSPRSTAKGKPQQSHIGPSRNAIPAQQAGQKPCPAPNGSRQPMQSGGNSRSSSPVFKFNPIASNVAQCPPNDCPFLIFVPPAPRGRAPTALPANGFSTR